jgi:hypothetical protein
MAQLALSIVGAVIGGAIGGPWGARIGWLVGGYVGGAITAESTNVQGPRIEDLRVTNSTYGSPLHRVWGTVAVPGVVIWSSDLIETEHKTESGGKGSSATSTVTTYTYSVDIALAICQGPILGVRRVWANGLLVYDQEGLGVDSEVLPNGMRFSTGTETQGASALIESYEGVGNVPGFRGVAMCEIEGLELEKFGNRPPSFQFEVVATDGATATEKYSWAGDTFVNQALVHAPPYLVGLRFNGELIFYDLATGSVTDTLTVDGLGIPMVRGNGKASRYLVALGGPNNIDVHVIDVREKSLVTTVRHFPDSFISTDITMGWGDTAKTAYIYSTGGGGKLRSISIPSGTALPVTPFPALSAIPRIARDDDGNFYQVTRAPTTEPKNTTLRRLGDSGGVTDFDLSGYGGTLLNVKYDMGRNSLVIATPTSVVEWDIATEAVVQQFAASYGSADAYLVPDVLEPSVWWTLDTGNTDVIAIDLTDGSIKYRIGYSGLTSPFGPLVGAGLGVYSIDAGNPGSLMYRELGGPIQLSQIVSELAAGVGLGPSRVNVTALTQSVAGYVQTRPASARAVIEPLQQAYWFDAAESDGVLKFVNRGGASVASLEYDGLVREGDRPVLDVRRTGELEIPREIGVRYINAAAEYDPGTQYDRRLAVESEGEVVLDLPIVLTDTEAKRIAEVNLYLAWQGRDAFSLTLPVEHLALDPTDVLDIPRDGLLATCRITRTSVGAHRIEVEAVLEGTEVYTPAGVGVSGRQPPSRVIEPLAYSEAFLMDVPPLRDADNTLMIYVAAGSSGTGRWRGAVLYSSLDGGATYTERALFTSEATHGVVQTALPGSYTGNIFDYDNDITVTVYVGSLSSATELAVLNGANAIWTEAGEIIQFATATPNGGGSYTLSGILRARKGTDYALGAHAAGEAFVLLNAATLVAVDQGYGEAGVPELYVPVTSGRSIDEETGQTFTLQGNILRPLSPVHLAATRNVSLDITVTWIRRTRIDGEWRDGVDAGLGETFEQYVVEAWDTGFTVLKRAWYPEDATTITYFAGEQTSDFGTPQSAVGFRIYQLAASIAGHPTDAIL